MANSPFDISQLGMGLLNPEMLKGLSGGGGGMGLLQMLASGGSPFSPTPQPQAPPQQTGPASGARGVGNMGMGMLPMLLSSMMKK